MTDILNQVIVQPHKSQWLDDLGDFALDSSSNFRLLEAMMTLFSKILTKEQLVEEAQHYLKIAQLIDHLPVGLFIEEISVAGNVYIAHFGKYHANISEDVVDVIKRYYYSFSNTRHYGQRDFFVPIYRTTDKNNKLTRAFHKAFVTTHAELRSVLTLVDVSLNSSICKPIHLTTSHPPIVAGTEYVVPLYIDHNIPENPADYGHCVTNSGDRRGIEISLVFSEQSIKLAVKAMMYEIFKSFNCIHLSIAYNKPMLPDLIKTKSDYEDFMSVISSGYKRSTTE